MRDHDAFENHTYLSLGVQFFSKTNLYLEPFSVAGVRPTNRQILRASWKKTGALKCNSTKRSTVDSYARCLDQLECSHDRWSRSSTRPRSVVVLLSDIYDCRLSNLLRTVLLLANLTWSTQALHINVHSVELVQTQVLKLRAFSLRFTYACKLILVPKSFTSSRTRSVASSARLHCWLVDES